MDTDFSAIVVGKCEANFIGKLSKPRLAAYRKAADHCIRKYEKKSGTMYVSFSAYCRAALAAKYSGK